MYRIHKEQQQEVLKNLKSSTNQFYVFNYKYLNNKLVRVLEG